MRDVLLVATTLTGSGPTGVETHFNHLIAAATSAGIDARLVSCQVASDWRRKAYRLIYHGLRRISPEHALVFLREADAWHLERKLSRELRHLGDRRATIYAQDPRSARAALRARRTGDVRVVMTAHFNGSEAQEMADRGLTSEGRPLWVNAMRVERDVMPRLDHVVFVSEFVRSCVLERLPELDRRKTSVIANSCVELPAAGKEMIENDLIAIGTLEPRKNQRYLLDVLARCHARGHAYSLTLVGPGQDMANLVAHANALGLNAFVRFLGHQPCASQLIPRHKALVHSALIENFPITLVEALAAGRPVFAGAVGGIPEVFDDGVEGHLWPLDQPDIAASLLIDTLEAPVRWEALSAAASVRYRRLFAPGVLIPRWLDILMRDAGAATTSPRQLEK